MLTYVVRRIGYGVLVLLGVNLATFFLFFTVNTPDDFVQDLAELHASRPELGIAGPHLYPFGGFDKLFDWLAGKQG